MCAIKIAKQKGMTMTTNIEWLYENDLETLITMTAGECSECKYDPDCAKAFCRCERKWLEAEYEEPVMIDSWEKIERDAIQIAQDFEEFCTTGMANEMFDLISRCKRMAGAE